MILFPAIDIKGGRCVRLLQGRAEDVTAYGDPAYMAARWVSQGAAWLHVVDLDGAFTGEAKNVSAVTEIVKVGVPVQLGGGIRTMADVEDRLTRGVRRVILGTAALENPAFVREACLAFPGHIACGIDAKDGRVAIRGWVEASDTTALDLALRMREMGIEWIIYTDIGRDGMLGGPNIAATSALVEASGLHIIGSGGVGSLAHITALQSAGCAGAIIGKALYENKFTLREAIALCGEGSVP